MEEMVDIVTADDTVVRAVSKRDAHLRGYLHRTVIAEVLNSKGEWLMVKQAGDRQDPGQYVSPVGGHVRSGETVEDALRREAKEELGLADTSFTYVGKAVYNREVCGRKENHYFIQFIIRSDAQPVLNAESVSFRFFSPGEMKRELREHPQVFGAAFHFVVSSFFARELR